MDLLVKLYDLNHEPVQLQGETKQGLGFRLRKPYGYEHHAVSLWVKNEFGETWLSELQGALLQQPTTCYLAMVGKDIAGFACYNTTALGVFGPMGIAEPHRGSGLGRLLTRLCLHDMRAQGFAYAVIAGVGPVAFYQKTLTAMIIPDSDPGLYHDRLDKS